MGSLLRGLSLHTTAVERAGINNLNEGDRVEYELQPG